MSSTIGEIAADLRRAAGQEQLPIDADAIAAASGVIVHYGELDACLGRCVVGIRPVIRVNDKQSRGQARFTLAHELGHLVLKHGVRTCGDVHAGLFSSSKSPSERQADTFAAELMLPAGLIVGHLEGPEVTSMDIRRLAKTSGMSVTATAIRAADLAGELGLYPIGVACLFGDGVEWVWAPALSVPEGWPLRADIHLVDKGASTGTTAYSESTVYICRLAVTGEGRRIIAFQLRAGTLSPQRQVPLEDLQRQLFRDDSEAVKSCSGMLGHFNFEMRSSPQWTDEQAADQFFSHYWSRRHRPVSQDRVLEILGSPDGRDYLVRRISLIRRRYK